MAKKKVHSTTQDFTEVIDISDDMVFFKGGSTCMIAEISSVNFFLLSSDEQNARLYGYMSLLNSLSSYIQILIVSRRIDMGNYLKLLDEKISAVKNPKIAEQLGLYRDFIKDLIKGEGLLDKKAYIVVPFSQLELGPVAATGVQQKGQVLSINDRIKSGLISKRNNVLSQVERMGLTTRPLSTDELIKLFYEVFNQDFVTLDFNSSDIKNVIL
ncbi:MAG TPA: hypothetical protein VG917_05600 [Patescibacteria group bacterium]|nr:hypothetical protein [Patescibacteria group bacterium]